MPVGSCLNGNKGSKDSQSATSLPPPVAIHEPSQVPNIMAEQFAFMQHTLLLQIFRIPCPEDNGDTSPLNSPERKKVNNCPTCVAFSELCCQNESGRALFYEFLDVNTTNYLWDCKLGDAIQSLRYQGYICPGILVTMTSSSYLEIIIDAWKRRVINSPVNTRITQVGLSGGCTIKPILQSHCISLTDILCLILAKLKSSNKYANIEKLISMVESDWAGSSRTENLREAIHSTLGQLIKQRRVYYTGNSGYFLVDPSGNNGTSTSSASSSSTFGNRLNRLRHSLRLSPRKCLENKECQTLESKVHEVDISSPSPSSCVKGPPVSGISYSEEDLPLSPSVSPSKAINLERSQSLRLSKRPLKATGGELSNLSPTENHFTKGGSLRLSKRDISVYSAYHNTESSSPEEAPSNHASAASKESPKTMDRKNSFLGKLFSKNKTRPDSKPEMGTFSAQFPPPELLNLPLDSPLSTMDTHQPAQGSPSTYNHPHHSSSVASSPLISRETNSPIFNKQENRGTSSMPLYSVVNKRRSNLTAPSDAVYMCPPPPLPYRPPHPPNPYNNNNNSSTLILSQYPKNPKESSANNTPQYPYPKNPKESNNFTTFAPDYITHRMPSPKSSSCSSSSGPSSMESQPHLYNKTLVVIEKSNSDLEHTLQSRVYNGCGGNATTTPNNCSQPPPRIDTIHNNRNLTQEVIYEVESLLGDDEERCRGGHEKDVCTEEETIFVPSKLSGASSSFSKPLSSPPLQTSASSASVEYPSVMDLSMKDISNQSFKSLTAQKLMAGLSFNSIDTLLEVNAAAEVRNRINESTETIDFGVI